MERQSSIGNVAPKIFRPNRQYDDLDVLIFDMVSPRVYDSKVDLISSRG